MSELPATIFETALDAVSSIVVITDYSNAENPIIYVNRAFEESTGYKKEEVIGLNPRFLHGNDRNQVGLEELSAAIASGRECKVCIRDYRKDQTAYWVEVHVFPLRNQQGEIRHFIGVQRDLTEIQASHLKAQFVDNVTHEVRTPLSGVIGLLEMVLMEEAVSPEMRETLERAMSASNELLSILNGLLDFSTLEAGRLNLLKEKFSLPDLISEIVAFAGPKATAKGLNFNYSLAESLPHLLSGDVHKIKHVLLHLIENALKFTEKGEITIKVEPESINGNHIFVRFCVADTGTGTTEDLQILLQPFIFASGSGKRTFGRSGLGLSIARGFVDVMGGKLEVTSKAGAGATFSFILPLEIVNNG